MGMLPLPTASAATTSVIKPVADTYVQSDRARTNYGKSTQLTVDSSPARRTFIKFAVAGLAGTVTSAKLRLHTRDSSDAGSPFGGALATTTNTSWSELSMTWNNKPAIGAKVASLGAVLRNRWYELDVKSVVRGNGTYSFALTSGNSDGAYYDSRETGSKGPQLMITTDASTSTTTTSTTTPPADPVLYAAGDIASCSSTGDEATAAILNANQGGTVITLGDNAYEAGSSTEFTNCYDPTWGSAKPRTRPAPGNHEYGTAGAAGYFGYFGAAAGDPTQGYYSYDLGDWHVVSLNSNCSIVSCAAGSLQEQWLRADLAGSAKPCTLAYWHHPRYSSGTTHGSSTSVVPLFQALYDFNADLVLEGHEHNYERFAPMDAAGAIDTARGIRSIVVGTGGRSHRTLGTPIWGSEVGDDTTYGVLKVTLHASGYDWRFLPTQGATFTDAGTQACH